MPGFTHLTLHHSKHASSLLNGLNALRSCRQFCDCTLVTGDTEFPVHKSVLAASSSYFRALFATDMMERESSRIPLQGISKHSLQSVLGYVYTGEVSLSPANITHTYIAADRLQLEGLKCLCHDYLLNQLTASNCIGIWKFAKALNSKQLEASAWGYMIAHFIDVKEGSEYLCLSPSELQHMKTFFQWKLDSTHFELSRWLHHSIEMKKEENRLVQSRDSQPQSFSKDCLTEAVGEAVGAECNVQLSISSVHHSAMLVAIGGYCEGFEGSCEQYCESTGTWQQTCWDLSGSCKCFHWVGVIGLRLYAIAGDSLTRINMVMSRLTGGAVEQLQTDTLGTGWELEATLPHDCSDMKFCIMNDCIYGCGCYGNKNATFGIYQYDPSDGSWEMLIELASEAKVFFQFFAYGEKLHLLGGMLHETSNYAASGSYEVYDPGTNTCERKESMAIGRYNFGVGILDHCCYAVGGFGNSEVSLSSVEMYCFRTMMWSHTSTLLTPRASMGCQGWKGKLYCLGGETATGATADALLFNPLDQEWNVITPLHNPRIYPIVLTVYL